MATPKTSIFDSANKFGYNSPFGDWMTEEAEKRAEREHARHQQKAAASTAGLQIRLQDNSDVCFYEGELYALQGSNVADAFAQAVKTALNSLWKSETVRRLVRYIQASEDNPIIVKENPAHSSHNFQRINWNYKSPAKLPVEGGIKVADAAIELFHELAHAYRFLTKDMAKDEGKFIGDTYLPVEEEKACHWENMARCELGKPLRTHYDANPPDDADFTNINEFNRKTHVLIMRNKQRIYDVGDYRKK